MSTALQDQQSTILHYLNTTHYIDPNAPQTKDKSEAKYLIGKACNKAREILCSDEAFTDWVWENIIPECSIVELEEVTPNTLLAWRKLPKFGTLEECETVGFTHISKLLLEKNADMKAQVLNIIATNEPEKAKILIKAILRPSIDFTSIVDDKNQLENTIKNINKLSKDSLVALIKAMHVKMNK